MKIVILSPTSSVVGGVERFCQYLFDVYEKAGHEVEIVSGDKNSCIFRFFAFIGLGAPYGGWVLGLRAKKLGYDVLVTNGLLGWNIGNGRIINIQHGTYVVSAERIDRGHNVIKWFIKKYIWGYFEGLAARRATFVVGVSKETAEFVEKHYKVKDVQIINNTIDFAKFSKRERYTSRIKFSLPVDKKLILFVGRFEYAKGSDLLVEILPQLVEKNYLLVLASDKKNSLPGIFSLVNVPNDDLPYLYSACDFFVLPSRHEGCSLALMEAMACDMDFLSTMVGSARIFAEEGLSDNVVDIKDFNVKLILKLEKMKGSSNSNVRGVAEKLFSVEVFEKKYLKLLFKIKENG